MIYFCTQGELIITNTFYQHEDMRKYVREIKSRNERSIIDDALK